VEEHSVNVEKTEKKWGNNNDVGGRQGGRRMFLLSIQSIQT